MSAYFCAYEGCWVRKTTFSSIAFFNLPTDSRRSTWIANSGNKTLANIGEKSVRYFCENHFKPSDVRTQFNRKTLRRDAVPIAYDGEDGSTLTSRFPKQTHKTNSKETNDQKEKPLQRLNSKSEANNVTDSIDNQLSNNSSQEVEVFCNEQSETTTVQKEILSDVYDHSNSDNERYFLLSDIIPAEKIQEIVLDCTVATDHNDNEAHLNDSGDDLKEENQFTTDIKEDTVVMISSTEKRRAPSHSSDGEIETSLIDTWGDVEIDCQLPADMNEEVVMIRSPPKKRRAPSHTLLSDAAPANTTEAHLAAVNNYEEDKHFALSLVGYFQRLPLHKKAIAKLKILTYLTDLEFNKKTSL